jgi:hypothetical protein
MSDIEDALREAMHAQDTHAPTTADFHFRAPEVRRASPWLAVSAAAACVLVVATVALFVSNRGNRGNQVPPPLASRQPHPVAPIRSCPAEMPAHAPTYWIPQPPKGIDAAKRFVPLKTPTTALVCAYLPRTHRKLTRARTLDGDHLPAIPADLAWLPPAHPDKQPCASFAALTDGEYYLMALSYPGGTMWLSMPGNHCLGASNGAFLVHNLRLQAWSASLGAGWKPLPPTGPDGCPQTSGRLGQQDRLVPERPVSVELCQPGMQLITVTAKQSDVAQLTAELNRLPATSWGYESQCGSAGTPSARYLLTFRYRVGPPVQVDIQEGCHPEVDNGSLQADDAGAVLTLVKRLLGH